MERKIHFFLQNQLHYIPLTSRLTSCLYTIFLPTRLSWACNICCTHISQHMTCRSHLMKLSGNECSGLMTEEGRTTTLHKTTLNNHSLVLLLAGRAFLFISSVWRNDRGYVSTPNTTSSSDTSPVTTGNRVDWNPIWQNVKFSVKTLLNAQVKYALVVPPEQNFLTSTFVVTVAELVKVTPVS